MGGYAALVFLSAVGFWVGIRRENLPLVATGLIGLWVGLVGVGIEYQHSKARDWANAMHKHGCAVVEMRGGAPSAFKCPDGVIYR